jgi:two-component system, OmpR family, sensor kinase
MGSRPPESLARAIRRHWIEVAWAVFAAINLVAIVRAPFGETVPFHFIWISLALIYGARLWQPSSAFLALGAVCLTTGVALSWALRDTQAGWDELTEVPLMGVMFLAMMYHVERRQAATNEVQRLAANERRLLERERDMVRDASHELRTPIAVARGHAELIRTAYAGQMAGDDAQIVLDELSRLARIADRLLILAAAEHPDFLRIAPVDIQQLLLGAERRWRVAADRQWRVEAPSSAAVLGDEERLESVLDALIENAVKYTHEGDAIELAASTRDGHVVVTVQDTGPGIDARSLERVFDRFSRGENGSKRNGTGLGLAIVKAITEAHGGTVSATSEVGQGARFEIQLPAAAPAS